VCQSTFDTPDAKQEWGLCNLHRHWLELVCLDSQVRPPTIASFLNAKEKPVNDLTQITIFMEAPSLARFGKAHVFSAGMPFATDFTPFLFHKIIRFHQGTN
jgi:hypothetical protein